MNKGLLYATGEYIQFLNSGDSLVSENIIHKIMPFLSCDYDLITGYALLDYGNRLVRNIWQSPNKLSLELFLTGTLSHQATYIRSSFFSHRIYDEAYTIVADWVFFFQIFLELCPKYYHVNMDIVYQDMSGVSTSNPQRCRTERDRFIGSIAHPFIIRDYLKQQNKLRNTIQFKLSAFSQRIVNKLCALYTKNQK